MSLWVAEIVMAWVSYTRVYTLGPQDLTSDRSWGELHVCGYFQVQPKHVNVPAGGLRHFYQDFK